MAMFVLFLLDVQWCNTSGFMNPLHNGCCSLGLMCRTHLHHWIIAPLCVFAHTVAGSLGCFSSSGCQVSTSSRQSSSGNSTWRGRINDSHLQQGEVAGEKTKKSHLCQWTWTFRASWCQKMQDLFCKKLGLVKMYHANKTYGPFHRNRAQRCPQTKKKTTLGSTTFLNIYKDPAITY